MSDTYKIRNGAVIREIEMNDHRLELDLSEQRLSLDVPDTLHVWQSDAYVSTSEDEDQSSGVELPLIPTLSDIRSNGFVSASILGFKAKQFDDGLYAAVEIAAQSGSGRFRGKASLLRDAAGHLAAGPASQPAVLALGACRFGGIAIDAGSELIVAVDEYVDSFLANTRQSKPLGFYTWSTELENIFRQDRLLQTELVDADAAHIAAGAFCGDSQNRATYAGYMAFIASMTNELVGENLTAYVSEPTRRENRSPVRIFPPSRSHEAGLVMKLYGESPIPESFSLADTLIDAVVRGAVDLAPTTTSGWYDHQTWAMEPLLVPERMPEHSRLALSERYRAQLRDVFKALLAMARETHVKQLLAPEAAAPPPEEKVVFDIAPAITIEPLPEHYRRRALSYRFVRGVLESMFGVEALGSMHRTTPDGPSTAPLDAELRWMEALFEGAGQVAREELGIVDTPNALDPAGDAAAAASQFRAWARRVTEDADLARDGRMMVPVFYDTQRRLTKVWAFLGWSTDTLEVRFDRPPRTSAFTRTGAPLPQSGYTADFHSAALYPLAHPVTAEFYVRELLNRTEMHVVCDRARSRSAIVKQLSAVD